MTDYVAPRMKAVHPETKVEFFYPEETTTVIRMTVEKDEAFERLTTKPWPSGMHPYHLAAAYQKAKLNRNAAANELRSKFRIVN